MPVAGALGGSPLQVSGPAAGLTVVVAGLIAEKAGGKPLWDQFRERLFDPLGIKPLPIDETNGPAFPEGYHRNALGPIRAAQPAARGWLWAQRWNGEVGYLDTAAPLEG